MPEGDAVARTAGRLTAALADHQLIRADLRWPSLGGIDLRGRRSLGTASYGKHLLTRFDDGRTLHTHLRMDGGWFLDPTPQSAHRRGSREVRAVLATQVWTCWGRSLGMMNLIRTRDEHHLLAHLGPDLMAPDAENHLARAAERMARDPRGIGEVLLDQSIAAGIGTIWASETLFRHAVSPWRASRDVAGTAVLTSASRLMRASAAGRVEFGIYDREHAPCPRCGTPIARGTIGRAPTARRVFVCPSCQAA